MNVHAIGTQLLTLFSPEERSIPDHPDYPGRNGAVLLAMNGGMQEIFGKASPWVRFDERGAILHPPATGVPITVTNGSTAAAISAGAWQAWFSGCQIQIDGASVENRIRNHSREVRLKFPHDGPTGPTTATVWHTSLDLDADVMEVTGKVKVNGLEILPWASFRERGARPDDFGRFRDRVYPANAMPGYSLGYQVETWCPEPTAAPAVRLRLSAAPSTQCFLEYSAMVVPMVITDLASLDTLPIPLQFVQSVFYPVARQRLTGCEFYRGGGSAEEIGRSYQEALRTLANLHPRRNAGTRIISRL